jgi:SPX domain protein involved in polyphosphate accumulation
VRAATAHTFRLRGNEIVVFPSTAKLTKEERTRARKTLSFAFKEYYRGLCLLDSYCHVNLEGFNNVLKKHDKVWPPFFSLTGERNSHSIGG